MTQYRTLDDMPDVRGKPVLVRSELNVPVQNGVVTDAYRIEKAIPTLLELSARGARVVVVAHIGRDPTASLRPVYEEMRRHIAHVSFIQDTIGIQAREAVAHMSDGAILLLENLRQHEGEKKNDPEFAKALASLAEYYVNDAFGVAHREHASVVGVPQYIPGYAGRLLEQELTELSKGLTPDPPSLFIIGGAKFATKEPLLEVAIHRYDNIYVGGALANDFLKAEGFQVGASLVSETDNEKVRTLIETGKMLLPADVVVKSATSSVITKRADAIMPDEVIVDVGPESVTELGVYITHARCIVWNGPLGLYEDGFVESTKSVAQLVADADGHSIVGGGDTVAVIRELGLEDAFGFLSTGGGAMLDYLVDGKLLGVEALAIQ